MDAAASVDPYPEPAAGLTNVTGSAQAREMSFIEAVRWSDNEFCTVGSVVLAAVTLALSTFCSVAFGLEPPGRAAATYVLLVTLGLFVLGGARYLNRTGRVPSLERPFLVGFHLLAAAITVPVSLLFFHSTAGGAVALAGLLAMLAGTKFLLSRYLGAPVPDPLLRFGFFAAPASVLIPYAARVPAIPVLFAAGGLILGLKWIESRVADGKLDRVAFLWAVSLGLSWAAAAVTAVVSTSDTTGASAYAPWGLLLMSLAYGIPRMAPLLESQLPAVADWRLPWRGIAGATAGVALLISLAEPVATVLTGVSIAGYLSWRELRRRGWRPRERFWSSRRRPAREPMPTPTPAAPSRPRARSGTPVPRWIGESGWFGLLLALAASFAAFEACQRLLGSESPWTALVLAATSWVPLAGSWLTFAFRRILFRARGPVLWQGQNVPRQTVLWLAFPAGLMLFGGIEGVFPWQWAAACGAALVTLGGVALVARRSWPFAAGGLFGVVAALWCVSWLGLDIDSVDGAAVLAIASVLLVLGQVWLDRAGRLRHRERDDRPVLLLSGTLAFYSVCTLMLHRALFAFSAEPELGAWTPLVVVGVLILAALLAVHRLRAPATSLLGESAALGSVLIPVIALDQFGAEAAFYGPVTLLLALLVALAPQRLSSGATAALLATGLWMTLTRTGGGDRGQQILVGSLALTAVVGRFALTPLNTVRSFYVIVGSFGLFWFGVARRYLYLEPSWLPALALVWAALALVCTRASWSGIDPRGGMVFLAPIAAVALLFFGALTSVSLFPGSLPLGFSWLQGPALLHAAAAFAVFGLAVGVRTRGPGYLFSLASTALAAPILVQHVSWRDLAALI